MVDGGRLTVVNMKEYTDRDKDHLQSKNTLESAIVKKSVIFIMSRGDQRERDRAKNQAKLDAKKKSEGGGGNVNDRNAADKLKLEAKIAMKAAQKKADEEAAAKDAGKKVITRKKGIKKNEVAGLDDLLSAGLKKTKKKVKYPLFLLCTLLVDLVT
eukprot:401532_1